MLTFIGIFRDAHGYLISRYIFSKMPSKVGLNKNKNLCINVCINLISHTHCNEHSKEIVTTARLCIVLPSYLNTNF